MPYKQDLIALLNRKTDAAGAKAMDWQKIIPVAEHSKVMPLLYYSIEDRKNELNIPDDVYSKLKKAYELNAAKNTLALEEFSMLARSMKEAGILLVLLHGTGLLHTIFQDSIAIRKMEDIDILVKAEDVRKASRVLAASGYRPSVIFDTSKEPGGTAQHNSAMYYKEGQGKDAGRLAPVHLHWHIVEKVSSHPGMDWHKIKMPDIWASSISLGLDSTGNIFTISPEHMLLALVEHGVRHGFATLGAIYDIHSYATRYRHTLDWQKLIIQAKAWGLMVPLRVGLTLSRWAFNTFIPDDFYKELKPDNLSALEKRFIEYIQKTDMPKDDRALLLHLASSRRLGDRLKIIIKDLRSRFSKKAR